MLTIFPETGPVANISVEIPGKPNLMEWQSCGAKVAVNDGDNELTVNAFVIDRADNPLRAYLPSGDLSTGRVIMPRVVRVVIPEFPDFVTDYVYDPKNKESVIWVYEHDRVISDIGRYLYGEWPISNEFIERGTGTERVHMLAETVLRGAGFLGTVVNQDDTIFNYRNNGHLDGAEAGTAPIQPVKFAV